MFSLALRYVFPVAFGLGFCKTQRCFGSIVRSNIQVKLIELN